jgi:hypothetical protein
MAGRLQELLRMFKSPQVSVCLLYGMVQGSDAFYARITLEFYQESMRCHRKFPLIRSLRYGVALCILPRSFDEYFMQLEAAARRNYKKAERNGYGFRPINFNDHLADVGAIRASAADRQGAMPADYLAGDVHPCSNPPSLTAAHAYPYFGVLQEGKLVAYAGVMIAGEMAMVEHILGHADHQADGVVPMLIIGMGRHLMSHYPRVKYYGYGSYFGADEQMRRFKRKFCFTPHRVKWILG